jgi:hypothetical protein
MSFLGMVLGCGLSMATMSCGWVSLLGRGGKNGVIGLV